MRIIFLFFYLTIAIFAKVDLNKDLNSSNKVKLFLWEAKKGNKKFYLVGTMHLPYPKSSYIVAPKIKKIIDKANFLHTEIPLGASSQMEALKYFLRDDNKTLKDILPKTTYQKLQNYLFSINPFIDIRGFDKFKIWSLSMMLGSLEYELKYKGYKPIDKDIYDYAVSKNKYGGSIESIKEQMNIFDDLSLKEQIVMLDASIDSYIKYPNITKKLLDYYYQGNQEGLEEIFKKSNDSLKVDKKLLNKLNNKLLFFRNKRMAKRIESYIKDNKIHIFAFGAMHFVGKRSIIDILKHKGYIIRRVTLDEVLKDDKRD